MKKTKKARVKNLLIMMMILAMMVPSLVFANEQGIAKVGYFGVYSYEGKVFQGPDSENNQTSTIREYEHDTDNLRYDFSVSNVVDVFVGSVDDYLVSTGFIVEPNSKITLLMDGVLDFLVLGLTEVGENLYEHDNSKDLVHDIGNTSKNIEGKCKIVVGGEVITIDMEAFNPAVDHFYTHLAGSTVTLSEPGDYVVHAVYPAAYGSGTAFIKVIDKQELVDTEVTPLPSDSKVTASPTKSKVLVNSEDVSFSAYNINNNNYFKLRDLAKVLKGTGKQFEVEWNKEVRAINLVSGSPYTSVGGEMAQGDGLVQKGILNQAKIYLDGQEVELTAYTINNNNYFKLRDVAKVFDVGVSWDGKTQTIAIDTSISYLID